jgi:hypothetical protein
MDQRTLLFPGARPSRPASSLGLPPELIEKSRQRLRVLAILILLATGADLAQMLISSLVQGGHPASGEPPPGALTLVGTLASFACSAIILGLTKVRRVHTARLIDLGLGFEVVLCLLISLSNPLSRFEAVGSLPTLTWVTPLIIFFPMIVPCPPRRTLVTAIVAAAMRPLGLLLLATLERIPVHVGDYLSASFSPVLAIVIAYFGSRAIYQLGMDVVRARRMGSYELESPLGRGGMGEVWRARHRLLARPAAIKLIRPEFLGGDGEREGHVLRQRFEREARSTAALRSPHTIELFDYGVADDGTFFYVMELLEGLDAHALVTRHGPVPWPRAVYLLRQVCHSLAEAHEAGLVHRDIKPANVFICRYGRDLDFVKVLDLGLVKGAPGMPGEEELLTVQGDVSGTPAFMAPEQAMGKSDSDARADLYSVGCLAYWLLTGELVFTGETALEILVHHAKTPPVPPSRRTELPIPGALEELVLSCLEKEPGRRPQSAALVSDRLGASEAGDRWTQEHARRWWEAHRPGEPTAAQD